MKDFIINVIGTVVGGYAAKKVINKMNKPWTPPPAPTPQPVVAGKKK